MLGIKQRKKGYELAVSNEIWRFESREEMEETLKVLLDLKQKYGNIKEDY